MKKSLMTWATTLLAVGAMALPTFAAGGGAGGAGGAGGGRGGRGGRGGAGGGFGAVDPATQIQNRLTAIRTSLNVTADDEWSVLSAKIQKVLEAKQKLAPGMPNALGFGGFGGGRGGRGGGGGGGGAGGAAAAAPADTSNPLAVAVSDLTTATAAGTTTADADLKAKLKTLRDARMGATKNVTDAQADLAKIVTVRQEAILVTLGVLD